MYTDPELAVELAIQAVNAAKRFSPGVLPTAVSTLHRAILESAVRNSLRGHSAAVESVAFSPDGKHLATGSWDYTAKIWDAVSGQELQMLAGHSGPVESLAFSPDGTRVATGSDDLTVKIWDPASGRELQTLRGHSEPVLSVAFSPDGKRLGSGSYDHTAKIWDVASGQELQTVRGSESFSSIAFSPGREVPGDGEL